MDSKTDMIIAKSCVILRISCYVIIIKEMSKQPIAYESIFAAFVPQIIIQKTIDIKKKIAISKAKNRPKTRWSWLP